MYQLDLERAGGRLKTEHLFIMTVLFLTGLGLVNLYSATYAFAERYERFGNNGWYFISRQLVFAAIGMAVFFLASRISLAFVRKFIPALVILAAVLCALTFFPVVGVERNGASRWIKIGTFFYQPSELAKLALPLYLAHIFDKKQDGLDSLTRGIVPPALVTVLFFFLIYKQKNFSTAFFIVMNALAVFLLAGVPLRYFFSAAAMIVPAAGLLVLTEHYRTIRFISFFDPASDPLGANYQVDASIKTVASGAFWGKGIGQGTRKIASVPEVHSDFVFSAYAEESGFLGVLVVFALFAVFAFAGYRAALKSRSVFNRLLGFGLVTSIVSQAMLNMAVVSRSVPATGIPLPFFSAGGSSLAMTLIASGLIANVIRQSALENAGTAGSFAYRADAVHYVDAENQDGD